MGNYPAPEGYGRDDYSEYFEWLDSLHKSPPRSNPPSSSKTSSSSSSSTSVRAKKTTSPRGVSVALGYDVDVSLPRDEKMEKMMPPIPAQWNNVFTAIAYTTNNHLTTPFDESEWKEEKSDAVRFSLNRNLLNVYTLDSPNSITLNYGDSFGGHSKTIVFGVQGSDVHVAVSLDTYQNSNGFRSVYHFGLLLSGNTYTVIDNKAGTKSVKNYMMVHLLEDHIVFMLCKTRKRAMAELNRVWVNAAKHGNISHYHKVIGHSRLSARIICEFLRKEQDQDKIPYNFGGDDGLKEHHDELQKYYPAEKLATITNCFLFVIRFAKLLNRAHTKQLEIPTAQDIIDWTIGKQEWYSCDIFTDVWDYGKAHAVAL